MQRVIELTNEVRMANGLSPLKRNDILQQAAVYIVEDNASRNTLSHIDGLGRDMGRRFQDFGYAYSIAAENLAAGYASPEAAIEGWIASSRDIFGCSKNRQNRIVENSTYPLDDFGFR
jgi:uncharacterized protein YkwD